jgi:hypothetical protein
MAKQIQRMKERDSELVTGTFKNLEQQGCSVRFQYKAYPGDDFTSYELIDGEKYTLPRGVARHLNNDCYYKEYKHLPGEFGDTGVRGAINDGRLNAANMQTCRKVHRYAFMSLDFTDDAAMYPSEIVEVTMKI